MTNAEGRLASRATVRPQPEVEIGNSFRLRPERPRVSRLSRKALIGGTAFGADPHLRCRLLGPANKSEASARPRTNSTQPITTTWQTNSQACQKTTPEFLRMCRDLDRRCRVILVVRLSLHRPNLVRLRSMPSSNGLIRRPKQLAPARYSPTPLPVHCLVRRASNETSTGGTASSDEAFAQNGQDRKLAFINASGRSTNHQS